MATFDNHIDQAKHNIAFLVHVNNSNSNYWDWQVTVSFYIAVHLVNAHIAKVANLHYRTHEDVKNAINPFNSMPICGVPEEIYVSYARLEGLSRRSRYLCHDDYKKRDEQAHFTYDKHFAKAVKSLDKILDFFVSKYSLKFQPISIFCLELTSKTPLTMFKVKN